jgi:hypothetical protein
MPRDRSDSVKRRKADTSTEENTSNTVPPQPPKRKKTKQAINTIDSFLLRPSASQDTTNDSQSVTMPHHRDNNDVSDDSGSELDESACSNKALMQVLLSVKKELRDVHSKFDLLGLSVEKLEGEVFDLKNENDTLKKQMAEYKKKQEETERKLQETHYYAKLAYDRCEANEQYSRRNNVKFLYVDESKGETAQDCEKKVLKIIHDKLKLTHITAELIEAAHRVGKKTADYNRPIIVKLVSRKTKQEIISSRRLLKECRPKTVIVEDMTKAQYSLYQCTLDHPGIHEAWYAKGSIYAKDGHDKVHRIEKTSDLSRLPPTDLQPSASSTPAQLRLLKRRENKTKDVNKNP